MLWMNEILKEEVNKIIEHFDIRYIDGDGAGSVTATYRNFHKYVTKHMWKEISEKENLSEEFLCRYRKKLNWIPITRKYKFSSQFIYKNFNYLYISYAYQYQDIPEELLLKIRNKHKKFFVDGSTDLKKLYRSKILLNLSSYYLKNYEGEYSWFDISKENKSLTISFLKEHSQNICWGTYCAYNNITEEIIKEFPDEIYWKEVSANKYLKPNVLLKHKDKIDWKVATTYCFFLTLKGYIKNFEDLIHWEIWLKNDKIDLDLKKEYAHKINPKLALEYNLITKEEYKDSLEQLTKFDIMDV